MLLLWVRDYPDPTHAENTAHPEGWTHAHDSTTHRGTGAHLPVTTPSKWKSLPIWAQGMMTRRF